MWASNKLSRVVCLKNIVDAKGDLVSKSQKLFSKFKLVSFENGLGTLLPIMVKSLRKLETLIRKEMDDVSAQEILLPSLTQLNLFEKSGRENLLDLFKLNKIHDKTFVLNPTCEEAITHLVSSDGFISETSLPYRFYQISSKFRNEKRVRSGLLRSREFLMKDLYTFDRDAKHCEDAYEEINKKYHEFFQKLKLPFECIRGSEGDIKGLHSNEFHLITDAGEDELVFCQNCGHKGQSKAIETEKSCEKCSGTNVEVCRGIEVAHSFHLGTSYTKPLNAFYKSLNGSKELLHMNSFGIGITRLLAASVEVLCQNEEIRWPTLIAPYLLCIIPPKAGSKEEIGSGNLTESLYYKLKDFLQDNVIVDDRVTLTVGNRLKFVKSLGIPFILIVGKQVLQNPPLIEFQDVNANSVDFVQVSDVSQFIIQKLTDQLGSSPLHKKEELAV